MPDFILAEMICEIIKSVCPQIKKTLDWHGCDSVCHPKQQLTPSEAVYGFAGWLTCRKEKTVMSACDDAAPIAELVEQFCDANNLSEISENWPNNLIHPLDCKERRKSEIQ